MPPLPPDDTLLVSVDSKCFWDRVSPLHGAWWRFTLRPDKPLSQSRSGEQRLWQHIFLPDDCMNWQIKCICCWHGIQSKLKADSPKCLSNCLSQSLTVPNECCQVNDIGRGPHMSTLPAEVSAAELTEMTGNQTEDENIKMFTEVAMLTSYKKSSFLKEGFGWVGKTVEIKWEFIDWIAWKNLCLGHPSLWHAPELGREARLCLYTLHIFSPACTSLHTSSPKLSKPSYPGSPSLASPACVVKWSRSTMTGRVERVGGCFHVPLLAGQNKKPLFFGSWSALTAYSPLQVIIPFGDITGTAEAAKVMSQWEAYGCKWGVSHKNRRPQNKLISCYYVSVPNTYTNVPVTKNKKEKRPNGLSGYVKVCVNLTFLTDL